MFLDIELLPPCCDLVDHPVDLVGHPVDLVGHPVDLVDHPVDLVDHAVDLVDHPVDLVDHASPPGVRLTGVDSESYSGRQQPFHNTGAAGGVGSPPPLRCNSPLVNSSPQAGPTESFINVRSQLGVENVTATCPDLTSDPCVDTTDAQSHTHAVCTNGEEHDGGARPYLSHADPGAEKSAHAPDVEGGADEALNKLLTRSPAELYAELQRVDPDVALLHHPNNKRKIVRALQVFYQTGHTMTSLLKEQHMGQDNVKSGPLRYPNPCILWIKCDQSVLDQRLDSRVDDMIERGLIAELDSFYNKVQQIESQHHSSPTDDDFDYMHGVLQMIGFKEFGSYLKLTPEERASDKGKKEFDKGLTDLKNATRRYARKQIKWIMNRFCGRPGLNVPPVYAVDSTDLTNWSQTVQEALDVVTAFVKVRSFLKEDNCV
ncbi:tRNA dimethylallyltransferase [Bulinus truncatus]|nr:tRNA dimethylallyltransferase [Bulinus truncatus]